MPSPKFPSESFRGAPSRSRFKHASFFTGIGGFDLAFEREGVETVFQSEIDSYCLSVLESHFPEVQRNQDITSLKPESLPGAQLWTGGFPCQDLSVARGSRGREGLSGRRSGLFYSLLTLVQDRMPKVILLENVTGLLSSHDGNDFGIILQTLTDIGYAVSWRVLNARYFGSPQSRPRVFICAVHDSPQMAASALYENLSAPMLESPRIGFLSESRDPESGVVVPAVAYCLAATSGRHTGTDWSRSYVSYRSSVRRLTPSECEGLQGFPIGWTAPAELANCLNDDLDSLRYHALGNAVSVPTVQWIANRIVKLLRRSDNASRDFEDVLSGIKELDDSDLVQLSELVTGDLQSSPWKTGGLVWKGQGAVSKVSPAPHSPTHLPLINVIEKRRPNSRYFLTPNAATGILRRVDGQQRQLFPPLESALRRLASKN